MSLGVNLTGRRQMLTSTAGLSGLEGSEGGRPPFLPTTCLRPLGWAARDLAGVVARAARPHHN